MIGCISIFLLPIWLRPGKISQLVCVPTNGIKGQTGKVGKGTLSLSKIVRRLWPPWWQTQLSASLPNILHNDNSPFTMKHVLLLSGDGYHCHRWSKALSILTFWNCWKGICINWAERSFIWWFWFNIQFQRRPCIAQMGSYRYNPRSTWESRNKVVTWACVKNSRQMNHNMYLGFKPGPEEKELTDCA